MNDGLKRYARERKVYLYEVAGKLSLRPAEFSVQYMRHRLSEGEEAMLKDIIDKIEKEKQNDEDEKGKAI